MRAERSLRGGETSWLGLSCSAPPRYRLIYVQECGLDFERNLAESRCDDVTRTEPDNPAAVFAPMHGLLRQLVPRVPCAFPICQTYDLQLIMQVGGHRAILCSARRKPIDQAARLSWRYVPGSSGRSLLKQGRWPSGSIRCFISSGCGASNKRRL